MAQVIVIGNEKGGSGKTTTSIHLIISLMKLGFKVATIDLDLRQMSLTRYIQNRQNTSNLHSLDLDVPQHYVLSASTNPNITEAEQEEEATFIQQLEALMPNNDFIVIDTPGSNMYLSRLAHSYADMVITPINDSFIDLDLLGQIHLKEKETIVPGIYSAMLWEQKLKRLGRDKKEISWVVVRNRLSTLDAKNKRSMEESLVQLSKKFGFRIAPGFGDRVIFKELFLYGLTLHDAKKTELVRMSSSVIAARQELQSFMTSLSFPAINQRISEYA